MLGTGEAQHQAAEGGRGAEGGGGEKPGHWESFVPSSFSPPKDCVSQQQLGRGLETSGAPFSPILSKFFSLFFTLHISLEIVPGKHESSQAPRNAPSWERSWPALFSRAGDSQGARGEVGGVRRMPTRSEPTTANACKQNPPLLCRGAPLLPRPYTPLAECRGLDSPFLASPARGRAGWGRGLPRAEIANLLLPGSGQRCPSSRKSRPEPGPVSPSACPGGASSGPLIATC